MGQVLHGSATTTHAIRAAIQRSKVTAKELAERHGINPKTVAKWKKRTFVHDARMGPKDPRSTVLTVEEEAIAVAFRKHTLLPLDDCLYALQATIPHLTRSSLHRCYQRRRARGARYRATHQPAAGYRRRQACQESVQVIPYRLLPYRHRRGPDRAGKALPLRGHRQDQQIRLRQAR